MGISVDEKVNDCRSHRRKNHRIPILNRVVVEIEKFKETRQPEEEDDSLWKCGDDKYKRRFLTRETWQIIKEKHRGFDEYKAVWFKHSTSKFSFLGVAVKNKLATGDRMLSWNANVDASCIFCKEPVETVTHLFFECSFSQQIWGCLARVMREHYTDCWWEILRFITDQCHDKLQLFTARYVFQMAVHSIWRERNRRRHGEKKPQLLY